MSDQLDAQIAEHLAEIKALELQTRDKLATLDQLNRLAQRKRWWSQPVPTQVIESDSETIVKPVPVNCGRCGMQPASMYSRTVAAGRVWYYGYTSTGKPLCGGCDYLAGGGC